jgi:enoyl-CoA hydratase/carnithine racemase
MSDAVLYEVKDRVAVITINWPDSRTAISEDVRAGLFDALRRFNENPRVLVAKLFASGSGRYGADQERHRQAMPRAVLGIHRRLGAVGARRSRCPRRCKGCCGGAKAACVLNGRGPRIS